MKSRDLFVLSAGWLILGQGVTPGRATAKDITLGDVSYDPTPQRDTELNAALARLWQQRTGETVTIQPSHAGSGPQARSVLDEVFGGWQRPQETQFDDGGTFDRILRP
jgi:ABC-type sulfate transport system substrate-binding protein